MELKGTISRDGNLLNVYNGLPVNEGMAIQRSNIQNAVLDLPNLKCTVNFKYGGSIVFTAQSSNQELLQQMYNAVMA